MKPGGVEEADDGVATVVVRTPGVSADNKPRVDRVDETTYVPLELAFSIGGESEDLQRKSFRFLLVRFLTLSRMNRNPFRGGKGIAV